MGSGEGGAREVIRFLVGVLVVSGLFAFNGCYQSILHLEERIVYPKAALGEAILQSLTRLTDNTYLDVSPKIVIDCSGRPAVFWLSLEMRTPVINGRFYDGDGWSEVRDFGACVGHWDAVAYPSGGFLIARTHWGRLYLKGLNSAQPWTWYGGLGQAGRLALSSDPNGWYLIWSAKRNAKYLVQGMSDDLEAPLALAEFDAPIVALEVLPLPEYLLIFLTVYQEGRTALWVQPADRSLHPIQSPECEFLFRTVDPWVSAVRDANGEIWLVWQDGVGETRGIYVSSSPNGLTWSSPKRVSPWDLDCAQPVIATDGEGRIFIVWTEFELQNLRGVYWSPEALQWQPLSFLEEYGIKGEEASLAVDDGKLWLAWERKEEIYVAMFELEKGGTERMD